MRKFEKKCIGDRSVIRRSAGCCVIAFNKTASKRSGVVSSPLAGPLAAWMLPSSAHGRVYGVSRER
ncbi:hypothetical protein XocBAI15_01010 [Xanthomonas oryzae pv. oryzicola]|nr:hypothetical protein XocBAI20_21120 [Xanthomonas oryzae pv. oryzicola]OWB31019.1 hypothetical protein XocBAI15_01010 [Xanthomonas oryzae pv. oryzicola]OWB31778.1 hypothetical protein XocBAI21_06945 [Xanthomonas oryzae pv. oryzicola]